MGWCQKADLSDTPVTSIPKGSTGDKKFFAKWQIINYTITYEDCQGLNNTNPTTYNINSSFSLQPVEKKGYVFTGWTCNSLSITDISGRTGNIVLKANFSIIRYTVTYHLYDDATDSASYTILSGLTTKSPSARENYKFLGWYENANFTGNAITSYPVGTIGNKNLYAKWEFYPESFDAVGNGTVDSPYLIYTPEQFVDAFNHWGTSDSNSIEVSTSNLKLMKNIDISEKQVSFDNYEMSFSGIFEGNNLSITTSYTPFDLFLSGTIKNLTVKASTFSSTSSAGIVRRVSAGGVVDNCKLISTDSGITCYNADKFASIAYSNYGTVSNCTNEANIAMVDANSGNSGLAGIVYNNALGGQIANCINSGNLSAMDQLMNGGISVYNSGEISNCKNYGAISGGGNAGGICYYLGENGMISDCYNYGEISCRWNAGIVSKIDFAYITTMSIKNCYYLSNSTINSDIDWLNSRDESINSSSVTRDDAYILANLKEGSEIPEKITEI